MLKRLGTVLVGGWITLSATGCSHRVALIGKPNSELMAKMAEGSAHYTQGEYFAAERSFQQGHDRALQLNDMRTALRFLNSVGAARFASFRYKDAMRVFLDVRRLARQTADSEMLGMVSCNLSSLYLQQEDINAGAHAAEESLAALEQGPPSKWAPLLRAQAAILHSRQGRLDLAVPLFQTAIEEADAQGDIRSTSLIWDQLGYELITAGRLDEAEAALLESFRQRKLHRLNDVVNSYYTLGKLCLTQGNAGEADRLFSKAINGLATGGGTLPSWRVYCERGRARVRAHRLADALSDLRRAREAAHRLRLEVLPADSMWIATGVDQSTIWSELIRAAGMLHSQRDDPALARLAFEVAEESRAASLRALVYSPEEWRKRLPPEYWESLAHLRRNEVSLLQSSRESVSRESSLLQYRLTELEAEAGLGLDVPPALDAGPGNLTASAQRNLQPDEVLFSFHLDEPQSALWAITRDSFRMLRLPSANRISALTRRFRGDVEAGRAEAAASGNELFEALFGALPKEMSAIPRWLLTLDGDLFQVPFAALVTGYSEGKPKYLVEAHSTLVVPSALLLEHRRASAWGRDFVAVGDPIYNNADPRRTGGDPSPRKFALRIWPAMFAGTAGPSDLELPRLVGSGREIDACAGALPADVRRVILKGANATVQRLDESLKRRPAILHFATHFVRSSGQGGQALMALSLDRHGSPELLGPIEISRRRVDLDLVVLSGCSSGKAEALPAEGLMGMTRAWLAAGSRSVLATFWPALDDQGQLLVAFYKHLARLRGSGSKRAASDALRMAQLEMMNSSDAHRLPMRWGTYILAGRE